MGRLTQRQVDEMIRIKFLEAANRRVMNDISTIILKGKESRELQPITKTELEDRMHRMGHTDFSASCGHGLTEDVPNPDSQIWSVRCKFCKKVVL